MQYGQLLGLRQSCASRKKNAAGVHRAAHREAVHRENLRIQESSDQHMWMQKLPEARERNTGKDLKERVCREDTWLEIQPGFNNQTGKHCNS